MGWAAGQLVEGDIHALAIHANAPLVAATLRDGSVHVYDEEVVRFENLSLKKESVPTKVAWHPTKKYLAVAWNGGTVGLWCLDMESTLREGKIHQCRVTCLEWNPIGNRIISGDEDGGVVVWKVDVRGRLSTMSQYRLKGQITCCVFRVALFLSPEQQRPRDKDSPPFFLAGQSGSVYYADDMGHCTEATTTSMPVHSLFVPESQDALFVVSEDLVLSRFGLALDGKMTLDTSVKLSGGLKSLGINLLTAWIEPELLAITVNGSPVRMWDIANEETVILDRPELGASAYRSFKYNPRMQIMAVGSDNGSIILWQTSFVWKDGERSRTWEPLRKLDVGGGSILALSWGISDTYLAVKKAGGFQLISQQLLCCSTHGVQAVAVQIASDKVLVERQLGKQIIHIEAKGSIRALHVTSDLLAIYTGKAIELHRLEDSAQQSSQPASVPCHSAVFTANSKLVFIAEQNRIDMFSHQGLAKHTLLTSSEEGDVLRLVSVGSCLVLTTRNHSIAIFDVGGREPRLLVSRSLRARLANDTIHLFGINANATMVGFVASGNPSQLSIYSFELDNVFTHQFQGRTISSIAWDVEDTRLIVCELDTADAGGKAQIASLFVTVDSGIVQKDTETRPEKCDRLVGVAIPHFVFLKKQELQSEQASPVLLLPGREYVGVEGESQAVIKAITDFCFNLSAGNVDDAVKSVKLIRNESVWENMAKICVKLGRINLAKLCLGKLKNAKALRSMHDRRSVDGNGPIEQGVLAAIHLGLYDEAFAACSSTGRYDLMSELHQATGQWEKAIETAASKDRPALPTVFFNFAKHLKDVGDQSGAIAAYEKSNTARTHIPRMLLMQPDELRNYIDTSSDMSLKVWWAQNAESHSDYDTALKYYSMANDILSIVRVNCLSGKMEEAIRIADEHPDNAAVAYYIGRQLEDDGKIQRAITYFARAKSFASAIRLAKEHRIDKELMQLALQSTPESMNDVARYFEANGALPKAITLYSKVGNMVKAMDLCFRTKETALLETIATTLDPERDAKMIQKAANYLVEQGSTQNALRLLIMGQRYAEVLDICDAQHIPLSEELVDKMEMTGSGIPEQEAKALHMRIADCCFSQGSYQLACKQYTLAGDRLRAMGSLLKSGEKDKIIFFANVSGPKQPEIFIIAANFLQSMDWRADTSVMKAIIQFYTKAKAYMALARFYDSCALIEIDEFQNYEKAMGALKEAEKCLGKIPHPTPADRDNVETIKRKLHYIGLFLEAHQHAKAQQFDEAEHICMGILSEPEIDACVRVGDIYGLLIESSYTSGQFDKARQLLLSLSHRLTNVSVDYYVDRAIVQTLGGVPNSAAEADAANSVEEDY